MPFEIKKMTKERAKLRLAISGPSGSGKTYSALEIAKHMGGRICLFDTEYGSAAKYADRFDFDGSAIEKDYHPNRYVEALHAAEAAGYDIVILDSLSHAWNGPGGILELVSAATKRKQGNSYAAWDDVTPIYRNLIHSLLASPCHVIVTLRAKQDYLQEKDAQGRTQIKKVGMAPEIREGFSYEMDIEGLIDIDHNFVVGKTRCEALDGKVFSKPGKEIAAILLDWLNTGSEPTPKASAPQETLGDATAPVPTLGEAVTEAARNPIGNPPPPRHVRPDWMKKAALKAQEAGLRLKDIPALKLHESATSTDVENALVAWRIAISEGQPKAGDVWVLEQFDQAIEEAKVPEGATA